MKKILCAILALILLLGSLVACGEEESEIEIPEGLQIVRESKADGYIFFGPEGWKIANQGEIGATYLTSFNKTSITFVKAEMPEIQKGPETDADGKKIDYYKLSFDAYMNETSTDFAYAISPKTLSGSKTNFGSGSGAAARAYEYAYSYTAEGETYSCWQILLTRGEGADEEFFIFTYTSFGKTSDEASAYRVYLPKAQLAAKSFMFTKKSTEPQTPTPDYQKDSDGYILASDGSLSGFKLYLPADYEIIDNSALVRAKISDGANINIFRATDTGIGALDYMFVRRTSVIEIADKDSFKDLELKVAEKVNLESEYFKDWDKKCTILPEYDSTLKFGNAVSGQVVSYKYSYSHSGYNYVCYMIFGVSPGFPLFQDGYVFTYTALEDEFDTHMTEIQKILEKVEF